MVIPILMVELDEANPSFGQAASHQAIGGERTRLLHVGAIAIKSAPRFTRQIGNFRHTRLHLESHLIVFDTILNFDVVRFR